MKNTPEDGPSTSAHQTGLPEDTRKKVENTALPDETVNEQQKQSSVAFNRWASNLRPHKIPFRRRLARAAVALIYRKAEEGGFPSTTLQPGSTRAAFPGARCYFEAFTR